MNIYFLVLIAVAYLLSLSVIDSLVNRLIFGKYYKLSYFSKEKQEIYKNKDWLPYCIIFLIVLPVLLPVSLAYLLGGIKFVAGYIVILCLVEWDMIFGKLVFGDWLSDLPSIRLPLFGWVHFKLLPTVIVRLFIAAVSLTFILIK